MGNEGIFQLSLIDVRTNPARDPDTAVTFFSGHGNEKAVLRKTGLGLPPSQRFPLPAFPQSEFLHGDVVPSRFRARSFGPFLLTHGEVVSRNLTVLRDPKAWRAMFVRWRDLTAEHDPLKSVLESSPEIQVKGAGRIPRFTDQSYDDVQNEAAILAKAALLNLYAKLTLTPKPRGSRGNWFSFVRQIVALRRERFVAVVDSRMADLVRQIKENIADHEEFKHAPAGEHMKNFPKEYKPLKSKMFSIKTKEEKGNLQLTIAPGTHPETGEEIFLLDADIDENGDLLRHLADVLLVHRITGGTHPYDIHEYLLLSSPALELGYTLA